MISESIVNDNHFQEFLNNRQVTESTKEQYTVRMLSYCDYLNKNPTELIEEAEDDEDQMIRMKNRKIKRYLNDFLHHLTEDRKSRNYIKACMMTVRAFYGEFEIELPKIRFK